MYAIYEYMGLIGTYQHVPRGVLGMYLGMRRCARPERARRARTS
jgi:hypothetical protein